jgi:hypothetical protein
MHMRGLDCDPLKTRESAGRVRFADAKRGTAEHLQDIQRPSPALPRLLLPRPPRRRPAHNRRLGRQRNHLAPFRPRPASQVRAHRLQVTVERIDVRLPRLVRFFNQ